MMIGALVAWVVGSLGLACVLTPLLYSALDLALVDVPWPYSRVFNRVALLLALLLLVLLRRRIDTPLVAEAWRRERWSERLPRAGLGFVLALGLALAVLPLVVAGGEVRWSPAPAELMVGRILDAIPGAILASLLEEGFFRVVVYGGLARRRSPLFAAGASSLLYAWIHFLAPRKDFVYPGWSPTIGFDYFGMVLERFADPTLLMGFLGLFVVGLALCRTYQRQGSLALCVGLHAGWFVAAKAGVHLLQLAPGASFAPVVGKRLFLIGQPWTWIAVAVTVLLLEVRSSRRRAVEQLG